MQINILGVPLNYGCGKENISIALDLLRQEGLMDWFSHIDTKDLGDVPVPELTAEDRANSPEGAMFLPPINEVAEKVKDRAKKAVAEGHFLIAIGGDHAATLGSLGGVLSHRDDVVVIWIDAHADLNTYETSISGHVHGMPMAAALGYGREAFPWYPKGNVSPEDVFFFGPRSLDKAEKVLIDELDLDVKDAKTVRQLTWEKVFADMKAKLGDVSDKHVHVSFDVDSLDPSVAPGVSTPVPNGFTVDEAEAMICTLFHELPVKSFDLMEFHPDEDEDGKTLRTVKQLLQCVADCLGDMPKFT